MKKIEILFPLFLYVLTIYGLITISKNPATGYEMSIYDSSFNELISLIASSLGAIIYIFFIDKERKILIITVLILVIMNNFVLLSLPVLRGYVIQGDIDSLTHLGYMKDIITKGNSNNLVYPISHILIVSISLLANLSLIQVTTYIPPLFSILYIIYIYLLSKKISEDRDQTILIVLSSITFLFLGFEAEFKPQFLSLIVIPIFLYFLFSRQVFETRVIILMLVILVQFFHPLTSLYFVIGISSMVLYMLITKQKYIIANYNDCKNLLSIGMISFILWIYHFRIWNSEIIELYKLIKGNISPPVKVVQSSFVKLKLTNLEIMEVIIRMYGHILIFAIISLIFIVYYFKFKRKKDSKKELVNILIFLFISGIILQMIIVGGGIALNIFRGLNYVVVLTPIFVGSFLYQLKKKYFMNRIIIGIILLSIISFTWLIGVFGIFSSPLIIRPTDQVTKTDIYGSDWFFKNKNSNVSYTGGHIYIRFSHLILGVNATNILKTDPAHWEYMLPDHFNYDRIKRLGENFTEATYMPITVYDKLLYTTGPWKPVGRFTNKDFDNLSYDSSINNLYDNGAMNIYYIKRLSNYKNKNKNKNEIEIKK